MLTAFAKLGLTSFGGPIAHLGYFRDEFVQRRRWVDDQQYGDLVALCQCLPGPASSEVAMALGLVRAGPLGGLLAWIGFTLPSAIAMVAFALLVGASPPAEGPLAGLIHGLKLVAVAVVAHAVWGMGRSLAPDRPRATLAMVAAVVATLWQVPIVQVVVIGVAALVGWRFLPAVVSASGAPLAPSIGRRAGAAALALFFGLLVALPVLRALTEDPALALVDSFYRTGALVFGGGHVVLPLLQAEVVPPGWVSADQFLAGYGAAQAVPGPLFTFAAYLGAIRGLPPTGVAGGTLALGAIFLPAALLVYGALPLWHALRDSPGWRSALNGVNAAVVGLLLAALYSPVITSTVLTPLDAALALTAFTVLAVWKLPPWLVVVATAAAAAIYSR